jgi:DNA-binding NarL/FixJ family response regulator
MSMPARAPIAKAASVQAANGTPRTSNSSGVNGVSLPSAKNGWKYQENSTLSDVLRLIALGHSNRQIARDLAIGEQTVKTHVRSILTKLGLQDRVQAAIFALRHQAGSHEHQRRGPDRTG